MHKNPYSDEEVVLSEHDINSWLLPPHLLPPVPVPPLLDEYAYAGWVKSSDNAEPVPRASVELRSNGTLINYGVASDKGFFSMQSKAPADEIIISSAGYITKTFPADSTQDVFALAPYIKDIDPVVLPPAGGGGGSTSNNNMLLIGGGLILLLLLTQEGRK